MAHEHRAQELKDRTKRFAIRIIGLYRGLLDSEEGRIVGRQLLKSGTSVGANYRAVCRARSHAEFVAKVGIVVEEADETVFWLEVLQEAKMAVGQEVASLTREAGELPAIFAASQLTAKRGNRQ